MGKRKNYEVLWTDHAGKMAKLMVPIALAVEIAKTIALKYDGAIVTGERGLYVAHCDGTAEAFWKQDDGRVGPPETLAIGSGCCI